MKKERTEKDWMKGKRIKKDRMKGEIEPSMMWRKLIGFAPYDRSIQYYNLRKV